MSSSLFFLDFRRTLGKVTSNRFSISYMELLAAPADFFFPSVLLKYLL
jgi:hypothetical protein